MTGSQYTIDIHEGQGVYSTRIRKTVNELKGEWSDPSCMIFTPPPPVSIKNHTIVSTNTNTSMTTVTIVVQISPLQFENCQTMPATKLELRSGEHVMAVQDLKEGNQDLQYLEAITMNVPTQSGSYSIVVKTFNAIGFSQSIEYDIS